MGELTFDNLLALADDETMQLLVGTPAVRLLRLIDPSLATPSRLRGLVTGLHSPEELLRDAEARELLLMLLRPDTAGQLQKDLELDGADPYEALRSLRFRKGSDQEARLFAFFGVVPELLEVIEESPEVRLLTPEYVLFNHQRQAVRKVQVAIENEPHRVLLHMPTGSGKTRTAMNVIANHLRSADPRLVVWLAYSEELCEQAAEEFEQAWALLGDRPLHVYRFWGNRSFDPAAAKDGLLVAGLGKTYAAARRSIDFISRLADRTSLVIIDEAHQAIADTYRLVLEVLVELKPATGLLGLTATPGRTWAEIDVDEELAEFFGRRKVTLDIEGYSNPVDFLVAEGYLARPSFESLFHSGGISLSERDMAAIAEQLDIPDRVLERLAEDEQRNLGVVQKVEELARRHERVLVFAATVEHARLLATVLRARGIDAASVTGETPAMERARVIARFRSDTATPMVLCNYGVLTAGFDAPRTSAAVIARPTKSLVLYLQMIGRATRGPSVGGNTEAEIVTVVDTDLPGFRDLGEAFLNWEDVWQ